MNSVIFGQENPVPTKKFMDWITELFFNLHDLCQLTYCFVVFTYIRISAITYRAYGTIEYVNISEITITRSVYVKKYITISYIAQLVIFIIQ